MSTKWTPGPWVIGMSCDRTPAVMVPVHPSEGSGFVVAHINRLPRMGSVIGDAEANARLIAAAPALYDALNACLGLLTGNMDGDLPVDCDPIEMARQALASASTPQGE